MPTICTFQLDRLNTVYGSGEYVNGRILLKTDKMKRVNSVFVTVEGEAKVQWSITGKGETTNYHGRQQYLHSRANVFDNTEFPAGTHVYVLSLRIPPNCPSSCHGPYGYIAYNVSLTLEKPWTFNEVFRKPITVIQSLDLNYNPEYTLPIKDEHIKYLCRWPCTSGPILSTLVVPYTGHVPDQFIPFMVEIDNQSPHYDIVCIEATLRQHYVFLARKPLKRNYFMKTIAKTTLEERTLRLTKRMYQGNVRVPPATPRSTLNTNYIVFLHYMLQVRLKTGILHFDIDITVPVVIGTVPLRTRQDTLVTRQPRRSTIMRATHSDSTATSLDEDDDAADEPPSYDSCLPPSFSFATLGSQQTIDSSLPPTERQHINIHLPHFPVYNTFGSHTQPINSVSQMEGYNFNRCSIDGSSVSMECNSLNNLSTSHGTSTEHELEQEDNL